MTLAAPWAVRSSSQYSSTDEFVRHLVDSKDKETAGPSEQKSETESSKPSTSLPDDPNEQDVKKKKAVKSKKTTPRTFHKIPTEPPPPSPQNVISKYVYRPSKSNGASENGASVDMSQVPKKTKQPSKIKSNAMISSDVASSIPELPEQPVFRKFIAEGNPNFLAKPPRQRWPMMKPKDARDAAARQKPQTRQIEQRMMIQRPRASSRADPSDAPGASVFPVIAKVKPDGADKPPTIRKFASAVKRTSPLIQKHKAPVRMPPLAGINPGVPTDGDKKEAAAAATPLVRRFDAPAGPLPLVGLNPGVPADKPLQQVRLEPHNGDTQPRVVLLRRLPFGTTPTQILAAISAVQARHDTGMLQQEQYGSRVERVRILRASKRVDANDGVAQVTFRRAAGAAHLVVQALNRRLFVGGVDGQPAVLVHAEIRQHELELKEEKVADGEKTLDVDDNLARDLLQQSPPPSA